MEITEIRVLPVTSADYLLGFASITFDGIFAVRELKIIEGIGRRFVQMPTRRMTDHCPHCNQQNHIRAKFCNECGGRLARNRGEIGRNGKLRIHADVAHPVTLQCRQTIEQAVLAEYEAEVERAKQPGYVRADQ